MTELKAVVQAMATERAEMQTVGNPLIGILDNFKFYEPSQPSDQSPMIEEVTTEQGGAERSDKEKEGESEETDEEIRVDEPAAAITEQAGPSRSERGKEKIVEEEEEPAEKRPIFLEELGTTIPADELEYNFSQTFEQDQPELLREAEVDFGQAGERDWGDEYYWNVYFLEEQGDAPAAEGKTPVESGNGNTGADAGEGRGDEQEEVEGADVRGREPEEMDQPGTHEESAVSTGTYNAWTKLSIKERSEIKKKGKPPPLKRSPNDDERFRGNAAIFRQPVVVR